MISENCFLLLGKTGVGKSTMAKILSENTAIKIGDSLKSETQETNCYDCQLDNFKYSLIDTPGYDDSNGNDARNYSHIKKFLTSSSHKIKGIVLLFSFQDARFGDSHRKGLEKIVNLIPLDNFWSYVTVVFTKTFWDDPDELNEIKEKRLSDFKNIFETLMSAFYKVKLIKKVEFSKINIIFLNLKEKKTKKQDLQKLISIFKKNVKLEPLFHQVKIEEIWEKNLLINKNKKNVGDLFDVKYKIYNYYNNNGKIIKTIKKPVDKKFIKQIEKIEYDGNFQSNCNKVFWLSDALGIAAFVGSLALEVVCPPVATALLVANLACTGVWAGSLAASGIKTATEYASNKEFNEQKVIDELKIEEEEEYQ